MIKITSREYVKAEDLDSGAKLILVFNKSGKPLLKNGRFRFYDTKYKTIF